MPVSNTRVAVTGAPKADGQFSTFAIERGKASKLAEKDLREIERLSRELKRITAVRPGLRG